MNDINRYGRVRRHQNLLTHPSEIVSSVPAKVGLLTVQTTKVGFKKTLQNNMKFKKYTAVNL